MLIDLNQPDTAKIALGNYKHTRSSIPPLNPSSGDTFEEVTPAGEWIQNWFWNQTLNRWLSLQSYKMQVSDFSINSNATRTLDGHSVIVDSDLYFIKTMQTYYPVGGGSGLNSTNYWNFSIRYISNTEETPFITIQTPPSPDFIQQKITTSINTLLITSEANNLFYRFAFAPTGSPSNLINVVASAIYRLARK